MSDNLFDYNPVSEWNGNVANVGMPTPDGNAKVTEIIITSNDALDATQRCLELSLESLYYAPAMDPLVLANVRSFFDGTGGISGTVEIILNQAFIESPYRIQVWGNEPDLPANMVDEMRPNPENLYIMGTSISYSEYLLLERTPPPSLQIFAAIEQPYLITTDLDGDPLDPLLYYYNIDPLYGNYLQKKVERAFVEYTMYIKQQFNLIYTKLTADVYPLPAPSPLDASDADYMSPGVVNLSWDNEPGAISYNVYRSHKKTAFNTFSFDPDHLTQDQTLVTNTLNNWFTDTTLPNIGTYYYWVGALFTDASLNTRVGLLTPGSQCSLEHSCTDPTYTTQSTCEATSWKCILNASNEPAKTRKMNDPTNWVDAFSSDYNCTGRTAGCYYSSTTTSWTRYSPYSDTKEHCLDPNYPTSAANNWSSFYWYWIEDDTTTWSNLPNGSWGWNYSPYICASKGQTWNIELLGEEGSVAGDPYIEKATNLVASEGLLDEIQLSWDSNPTIDPLIGSCADCQDPVSFEIQPLYTQAACEAVGTCLEDNSFNNTQTDCENSGYCSIDGHLEVKRYSGYTADAFDNNFGWFDTATQIDTWFTNNINTQAASETYIAHTFRGYFTAQVDGTYTFFVNSDDSAWLWLGDAGENLHALEARRDNTNELIDNSGTHAPLQKWQATDLVEGETYPILMYHGQGGGPWTFEFYWKELANTARIYDGTGYFSTSTNSLQTAQSDCATITYCSDAFWTDQAACEAVGTCSNATWNNDQTNCEARGDCYVNEFWSADWWDYNVTQATCDSHDDWWNSVTWYGFNFTSANNVWTSLTGTWTLNTFASDGFVWNEYPQLTDPPSCVTSGSTWIPDPAVQNTPDFYNVYRSTQTEQDANPPETQFVVQLGHTGAPESTQTWTDTTDKDKFALYHYKVTQLAGGVEGDFSVSDSGWEDQD